MIADFWKGTITGLLFSLFLGLIIISFRFLSERDRKIIEQLEKQNEIQILREDYINRDPYEFLDDIPGVRRAADDAANEFREKRDEAVQRFRSGTID